MAKIINLRTRRKQNTRAANRKAGDENAALNGRSKAEIAVSKARADKSRRDLDGHQRQPEKSS